MFLDGGGGSARVNGSSMQKARSARLKRGLNGPPTCFCCHMLTYTYFADAAALQVCRGTAVTMVSPTTGAEEIANPFLAAAEEQQ